MKNLFIAICLLWAGASQAASYAVYSGSTVFPNISTVFDSLESTDTDYTGDTFTLAGNTTEDTAKWAAMVDDSVTIDLSGYTVTVPASAQASWMRCDSGEMTGSTIKNGTFAAAQILFDVRNTGMTFQDLTITTTDTKIFYNAQANTNLTIDNCTMSGATVIGFQQETGATRGLIVKDCTFSDFPEAFRIAASGSQDVLFSNSIFTDCTIAINASLLDTLAVVGCSITAPKTTTGAITGLTLAGSVDSLTFKNNTLTGATLGRTSKGLVYLADSTATKGITITGNTFSAWVDTVSSGSDLIIGTATDLAQATGGCLISGNSFPADAGQFDIKVRANQPEITANTFGGSTHTDYHSILVGSNDGYDIADNFNGYGALIHANTWTLTSVPASGNAHICATKARLTSVYENTFNAAGVTAASGLNFNAIVGKGADSLTVYNNTIIGDGSELTALRTAVQATAGNDSTCHTFRAFNNKISSCEHFFKADSSIFRFYDIDNNYIATNSATADSEGVDLTSFGSWYGDDNFTDATSWRMRWGGKAGLTSIAVTPAGFVELGPVQTSTDPIIAANDKYGFSTVVEAHQRIKDLGSLLSGVTLEMRSSLADQMNLYIFKDMYPADSLGQAFVAPTVRDTINVIKVVK